MPSLNMSHAGLAELKRRLWFLFLGIMVFRIGAHVPVPGLDPLRLAELFNQQSNSIIGLFNMFSGGALQKLTIFALGIMPYISASIIVQLMTSVLPSLEQLKKEGEMGRRKINQYTRYGTLVLALVQSMAAARWLVSAGIALQFDAWFYLTAVITLVTGTMFLMWLGEQITERGIGNGISMIIFAGIVSQLPQAVASLFQQVREGQLQGLSLIFILLIALGVVYFVVFMERAQRQIRIQYPHRQDQRRQFSMPQSHLPLKLNMSGVIPPIFASSVILLPATIAQFFGQSKGWSWLNQVSAFFAHGQPVYMILMAVAIIFFSYFYAALVFNPRETADNLKKSGAFIPGIRPGTQTAQYIDDVMTRITLVGSLYLVFVSLLPDVMVMAWHVPFYFGGTSLLIVVVVVMDFTAQVQSHLMTHQYESLLKKANLRGR